MASKAPSYKVLVGVNALAIIISLVLLGLSLYILYGSGLNIASLDGLPVQIYYVVIAFSLFVFTVSLLGVLGAAARSKILTILFTFLDLALALAIVIIAIFVLLYANGLSTTPLVDNSFKTLQTGFQSQLLKQAINFPAVWNVTQKGFKCCGIDYNTTYAFADYNKSASEFNDIIQSGPGCDAFRAEIAALHAQYPTYSSAAQTAANTDTLLTPPFCKAAVSTLVKTNTMIIGIIAGVLVLLMVSTAAAAIRLLTKVYTTQGGFVPPPEELGGSLAHGGPHVSATHGGPNLA